ncbi:MFS transporter [Pseudonocardia sp. TRM90224]|uniref:MFS transporter n=1 Tax=Pseudonocardia sp. TRM90224 TaxID=2812678 RepID=UPI001E636890|nr:MFS transporter [Pseudonocardia sp. TRM90224]
MVDTTKRDPKQLRRVVVASAIGTTIEWYDYFIYSTAAGLIFATQFFPNFDPASALLLSFTTLGVGFVARPIGGALWGHFGDRIGRKRMLVSSLLLMGFATVGVGLLPTYGQVGVLAPILLVVMRLLQGLSAGGEWGGAALMAVEHAPPGQRGRYGSFSQIGVPAGLILAQLMFFLVRNTMTEEQFLSWGWRIPFLVSIVLVGVGLFVRLQVEESPVFRSLRDEQARLRRPLADVFRERPRELVIASLTFVANTAIGYVFLAYLLPYGTRTLGVSGNIMLIVIIIGSVSWLISIVAAAIWSDRAGRKPVYLIGSVLLVLWSFPFFLLVDTASMVWMIVAVVLLTIGLGLSYGPQSALFAEMFEPQYRYSGASFSYAIGAVLGGGFAPTVATWLQSSTGTSLSISGYMVLMGVISLVAVIAMRETNPPAHRHPQA